MINEELNFHARDAIKIKKIHTPQISPNNMKDELLQPTKKLKIDSPSTSPRPPSANQETKKQRSFWTQHINFHEGNDEQEEAKGGINIEELIDEEIQSRTQKSTSVWSKSTSAKP